MWGASWEGGPGRPITQPDTGYSPDDSDGSTHRAAEWHAGFSHLPSEQAQPCDPYRDKRGRLHRQQSSQAPSRTPGHPSESGSWSWFNPARHSSTVPEHQQQHSAGYAVTNNRDVDESMHNPLFGSTARSGEHPHWQPAAAHSHSRQLGPEAWGPSPPDCRAGPRGAACPPGAAADIYISDTPPYYPTSVPNSNTRNRAGVAASSSRGGNVPSPSPSPPHAPIQGTHHPSTHSPHTPHAQRYAQPHGSGQPGSGPGKPAESGAYCKGGPPPRTPAPPGSGVYGGSSSSSHQPSPLSAATSRYSSPSTASSSPLSLLPPTTTTLAVSQGLFRLRRLLLLLLGGLMACALLLTGAMVVRVSRQPPLHADLGGLAAAPHLTPTLLFPVRQARGQGQGQGQGAGGRLGGGGQWEGASLGSVDQAAVAAVAAAQEAHHAAAQSESLAGAGAGAGAGGGLDLGDGGGKRSYVKVTPLTPQQLQFMGHQITPIVSPSHPQGQSNTHGSGGSSSSSSGLAAGAGGAAGAGASLPASVILLYPEEVAGGGGRAGSSSSRTPPWALPLQPSSVQCQCAGGRPTPLQQLQLMHLIAQQQGIPAQLLHVPLPLLEAVFNTTTTATLDHPSASGSSFAPASSQPQADPSSTPLVGPPGAVSGSSSSSSSRGGGGGGGGGGEVGGDPVSKRFLNIGVWRHTQPVELQRVVYQPQGGVTGDMCFFVRPKQGQLMLGEGRWLLAGGRLPDQAMEMAASGEQGRRLLLDMMATAQRMGLNTLRLLAFNDGHTRPYALQLAPGILDLHVLHEGLDWIVWQARRFNLRVLLVLTSMASPERGGAAQYVRWFNPRGVLNDFYRDDTYKARYFDYLTAMAVHVNPHTGLALRRDPTVLGWDLGEGASDPGFKSGEELQGWIPYVANFLRRMDPNHLIMLGTDGLFGPSSPHLLEANPSPQLRLSWLQLPHGAVLPPLPRAPACEGVDWMRSGMLQEVDVAVVALRPDAWMACSDNCKLAWAQQWLVGHVRDALRIQKPLLISDMSMHGPPGRQAALQQQVLTYLATAASQGLPVAGAFITLPLPTSGSPLGANCSAPHHLHASFTSGGCYKGAWALGPPPSPPLPWTTPPPSLQPPPLVLVARQQKGAGEAAGPLPAAGGAAGRAGGPGQIALKAGSRALLVAPRGGGGQASPPASATGAGPRGAGGAGGSGSGAGGSVSGSGEEVRPARSLLDDAVLIEEGAVDGGVVVVGAGGGPLGKTDLTGRLITSVSSLQPGPGGGGGGGGGGGAGQGGGQGVGQGAGQGAQSPPPVMELQLQGCHCPPDAPPELDLAAMPVHPGSAQGGQQQQQQQQQQQGVGAAQGDSPTPLALTMGPPSPSTPPPAPLPPLPPHPSPAPSRREQTAKDVLSRLAQVRGVASAAAAAHAKQQQQQQQRGGGGHAGLPGAPDLEPNAALAAVGEGGRQAGAMRAYWHHFMSGDALVACLEAQAGQQLEAGLPPAPPTPPSPPPAPPPPPPSTPAVEGKGGQGGRQQGAAGAGAASTAGQQAGQAVGAGGSGGGGGGGGTAKVKESEVRAAAAAAADAAAAEQTRQAWGQALAAAEQVLSQQVQQLMRSVGHQRR